MLHCHRALRLRRFAPQATGRTASRCDGNAVTLAARMKPRVMYIERKDGITGPARIGRVFPSKTGRTLTYQGRSFQSLGGRGFKANYFDVESGEQYWISNCRGDGDDALYSTTVEIDDDVREEYWVTVRKQPEIVAKRSFRAQGKHRR